MPRTSKKNATPNRPTKSGGRGRGTYTGRRGAARGNGGAGARDPGFAEVAGVASVPAVVRDAPQYRQKREVSLFIVPHASQRIANPGPAYQPRGFELWVVAQRCYHNRK